MSANSEERDFEGSPALRASFGGASPSIYTGNESPAPIRNPSPPREILGLGDNIGGTAFSKHWLYSTLMKLLKVVGKDIQSADGETLSEAQDGKTSDNGKTDAAADSASQHTIHENRQSPSSTSEKPSEITDGVDGEAAKPCVDTLSSSDHHVIDISEGLQDELCQLWDMSSDENVAKLLQEFMAVQILTEVISKSDAPRATEIAVGILGNMACTPSVCESMATCDKLVVLSLCLLKNTDAPTLVEVTRFLTTVLSNEKCREIWLKAYTDDNQYLSDIVFILSSSVNKDLITNTADLLDKLLDISDELCDRWSSVNLLTAIVEALKQLGSSVEDGTYNLLHCLQLMSTQTNGVAAIVDQVELCTDILLQFLLKICEDEIVNLEDRRAGVVASVVSVLNIALTSSPAGYSLLYSEGKCIRCMLKIVYACDKEVIILGTPKSSPSQTKGNSYLIKTLKDVLYHMIADTVSIMNKEESDLSQSEGNDEENDLSEKTTPSLLKYMNSECERPRLNSLITLIVTHDGHEVIQDILALCDRYKLSRLEDLILQSNDGELTGSYGE